MGVARQHGVCSDERSVCCQIDETQIEAWRSVTREGRSIVSAVVQLLRSSERCVKMTFTGFFLSLFSLWLPLCAWAQAPVAISKNELNKRLLLQIGYERQTGLEDFMNTRSRIVEFERQGQSLRMVEEPHDSSSSRHLLATIPIRDETTCSLMVDFNAGFNKIFKEEDRTGEDYYGRIDREDYSFFRLFRRKILAVSRHGPMLVLKQQALTEDDEPVLVYYYLSPYRPNPHFKPFELKNLDHFGFYETYPERRSGRTVLYAMKFDTAKPIVFALSSEIPAQYREAMRDGVLYWNKAFGFPLLQVTDAPEGVTAPNPRYNVIQWEAHGAYASTSHIQGDPLTGEILHAHVFIRSGTVDEGDLAAQNNRLRYIVSHEVGHALGLRHNFAKGPASTVMNYFGFEQAVRMGRDVILSGDEALDYDRQVIRYVYLGEALDVATLPPFCTDYQPGCGPFSSKISLGSSNGRK
jgi:Met-zincin